MVKRILKTPVQTRHRSHRRYRQLARPQRQRIHRRALRPAHRPGHTEGTGKNPARDPRPEFQTAKFTEGVEKIADLKPGMILEGTVSNVAAFGAFVDLGVHQDGLVHISAMSDKFVKDPRTVVKAGQVVKVKVMDVDLQRKRIALSLRLDDPLPDEAGQSVREANRGKQESRKKSTQEAHEKTP